MAIRSLWYQIVAYPVVQAPKFRNGQIACIVTAVAGLGIACAIVYCSRKWPPPLPVLEEDEKVKDDAESGMRDSADVVDSKDEIHPHTMDMRRVPSLNA
jgi:ACS family pantothenate transporter-like MFS transporter